MIIFQPAKRGQGRDHVNMPYKLHPAACPVSPSVTQRCALFNSPSLPCGFAVRTRSRRPQPPDCHPLLPRRLSPLLPLQLLHPLPVTPPMSKERSLTTFIKSGLRTRYISHHLPPNSRITTKRRDSPTCSTLRLKGSCSPTFTL